MKIWLIASLLSFSGLALAQQKTTTPGATKVAQPANAKQKYELDVAASSVKWTAKKVTGSHWGYVKLKQGFLVVDGTKPVAGEFLVDLASMTNEDIPKTDENNAKLIGHLKSPDFFEVEKYPEAKFVLKNATPISGNKYKMTGDLMVKGKTNPVSFDASVSKDDKMSVLTGEGKLTFDRAKHDLRYNSKTFFDAGKLGDKMIYDEVDLDLKLVAKNPTAANM